MSAISLIPDSSDAPSDGADGDSADDNIRPGRVGDDACAAAAAQTPEAGRERAYGNPDMDNRGLATAGIPLHVAKTEAMDARKAPAGEAQGKGAEARKACVHAGMHAKDLPGSSSPPGHDMVLAKDLIDNQVILAAPRLVPPNTVEMGCLTFSRPGTRINADLCWWARGSLLRNSTTARGGGTCAGIERAPSIGGKATI